MLRTNDKNNQTNCCATFILCRVVFILASLSPYLSPCIICVVLISCCVWYYIYEVLFTFASMQLNAHWSRIIHSTHSTRTNFGHVNAICYVLLNAPEYIHFKCCMHNRCLLCLLFQNAMSKRQPQLLVFIVSHFFAMINADNTVIYAIYNSSRCFV